MESEKEAIVGQEESTPSKYDELFEKIESENPTEPIAPVEPVEPIEPVEPAEPIEPAEPKTTEIEEQITYDDEKLIVAKGEDKKELVRVVLDDGRIVFVPEDLKGGYLMQSDYTKKTMALADEKKKFEEDTKVNQKQADEVFKLRYADVLGQEFNEPKPLESEFLNDPKYESEEQAKKAYRDADTKWWNGRAVHTENRATLNSRIAQVTQSNQKSFNAFKEKYGEEVYNKVFEKVQSYINPFVFRNIDPFPNDALELLHKGMNYDTDLAKAQAEASVKTVKNLNEKHTKTAVKLDSAKTQVHKTPDTTFINMPDRYKDLNKKINET